MNGGAVQSKGAMYCLLHMCYCAMCIFRQLSDLKFFWQRSHLNVYSKCGIHSNPHRCYVCILRVSSDLKVFPKRSHLNVYSIRAIYPICTSAMCIIRLLSNLKFFPQRSHLSVYSKSEIHSTLHRCYVVLSSGRKLVEMAVFARPR